MPKYSVLQPVRHDGARYPVGSTIDLARKQALQLIAAGALAATEVEVKAPTAEARIAEIEATANVDDLKALAAEDKRPTVAEAYQAKLLKLDPRQANAQLVVAAVKEAGDIATLKALAEGDDRATVKAAYDKRAAELPQE